MKKLLLLFILLFPFLALAAKPSLNYTPTEPIPGFGRTDDFYTYINLLYNFGIWTIGIVALFMIVFGGYMYVMSAGNNSTMEKAKGIIADALWGIVIAFGAYLLLYTINPELVRITRLTPVADLKSENSLDLSADWPPPLEDGQLSDEDARTRLATNGISINKANCYDTTQNNCTSLDGIPESGINNLIADKNTVGGFIVSGGTEYWLHKTHGPGKSVFDIVPESENWDSIVLELLGNSKVKRAFCDKNGALTECSVATHIHVEYN